MRQYITGQLFSRSPVPPAAAISIVALAWFPFLLPHSYRLIAFSITLIPIGYFVLRTPANWPNLFLFCLGILLIASPEITLYKVPTSNTIITFTMADVFVGFTVLLWIIKRKHTQALSFGPFEWCFAAFILVAALSLLINPLGLGVGYQSAAFLYLLRFLEGFVIYLIAVHLLRDESLRDLMYIGFAAVGVMVSIWALIGYHMGLVIMGPLGNLAIGPFSSRMAFGILLTFLGIYFLYMWEQSTHNKEWLFYFVVCTLLFTLIILTKKRTVWVGFVVSLCIYLWLTRFRGLWKILYVLPLVLLITYPSITAVRNETFSVAEGGVKRLAIEERFSPLLKRLVAGTGHALSTAERALLAVEDVAREGAAAAASPAAERTSTVEHAVKVAEQVAVIAEQAAATLRATVALTKRIMLQQKLAALFEEANITMSIAHRAIRLISGFSAFLDFPVFGAGFWLTKYAKMYGHPHNFYVQILGETGLVGFSLMAALLVMVLVWGFSISKRAISTYQLSGPSGAASVAFFVSLLALFVQGLSDASFFMFEITHWLWFVGGMLCGTQKALQGYSDKIMLQTA